MKFQQITEGLGQDADHMEQDHEVQMARADCFHAAKNAIELHRILRNISERQGLEGWVNEKITLAADYLRTVKEYLEYETMSDRDIGNVIQVKSPNDYNEIFSQYMGESLTKTQTLKEDGEKETSKSVEKRIKTPNLSARGRELLIKAFAKFPQSNNEIDAIINYLEYVKSSGDNDLTRLDRENRIQDNDIDELETTTNIEQQEIEQINQRLSSIEKNMMSSQRMGESKKNKKIPMKEMTSTGTTASSAIATTISNTKKPLIKRTK